MLSQIARKLVPGALVVAGLAAGVPAFAQYGDPYYRPVDRGPYYDNRVENRQPSIIEATQRDLDRAASNPYLSGGTRGRIDHARKELWDFQRAWSRGRFDKGELDEAIGAVNSVVNSASLDYRDRRVLTDDLYRMRDFRAARGYAPGYYGYR